MFRKTTTLPMDSVCSRDHLFLGLYSVGWCGGCSIFTCNGLFDNEYTISKKEYYLYKIYSWLDFLVCLENFYRMLYKIGSTGNLDIN